MEFLRISHWHLIGPFSFSYQGTQESPGTPWDCPLGWWFGGPVPWTVWGSEPSRTEERGGLPRRPPARRRVGQRGSEHAVGSGSLGGGTGAKVE